MVFIEVTLCIIYVFIFLCVTFFIATHARWNYCGLISQILYALERVSASVEVLRGPDGTGLEWTGL